MMFFLVPFADLIYSASWQMLGVSHFSSTLLEAAENELKVSVSFSYLLIKPNLSPSHSTGLLN